jgi:hypothetical protein
MPASVPDVLLWAEKRQLDSTGLEVRELAVRQAAGTCSQIVACNGCRSFLDFISNPFLMSVGHVSPPFGISPATR